MAQRRTPPAVLRLARRQYEELAAIAGVTSRDVQRLWRGLPSPRDPAYWREWFARRPAIVDAVRTGQLRSVVTAQEFSIAQALVQGITVPAVLIPAAMLSPEDHVADVVQAAPAIAIARARAGEPAVAAALSGLANLVQNSSTLVHDAGTEGTLIHASTMPETSTYVRTLRLPSCTHCAVLAGKHFDYLADFDRHPSCDCTAVPIHDAILLDEAQLDVEEAIRAGKVHGLNKAETEAIVEHGADPNRIINAKRSKLDKINLYGKDTEVRYRGHGRKKETILTPRQITKTFGPDPDNIRRGLVQYGYATETSVAQAAARIASSPIPTTTRTSSLVASTPSRGDFTHRVPFTAARPGDLDDVELDMVSRLGEIHKFSPEFSFSVRTGNDEMINSNAGGEYDVMDRVVRLADRDTPGMTPGYRRLSILHEIGHHVDYTSWADVRPLVATGYTPASKFKRTVGVTEKMSPVIDRLLSEPNFRKRVEIWAKDRPGFEEYMESRHEVWARAYAQYAANHLKDADTLDEIENRLSKIGYQWDNEWFVKEVAPLMDNVFAAIGAPL